MVPDIRITEEAGIIRVVYRGKVEYGATTGMLRGVAQLASEKKIKELLFDISEADYRHYYAETLRHAEEGPSLGIDRTFRIAFLGAAENPMLRYIEDASVNRGFRVKAFIDEAEAKAWLRSAP